MTKKPVNSNSSSESTDLLASGKSAETRNLLFRGFEPKGLEGTLLDDLRQYEEDLRAALKKEFRPVGVTENALISLIATSFVHLRKLEVYVEEATHRTYERLAEEVGRAHGFTLDDNLSAMEGSKILGLKGKELEEVIMEDVKHYEDLLVQMSSPKMPLTDIPELMELIYLFYIHDGRRTGFPPTWRSETEAFLASRTDKQREMVPKKIAQKLLGLIKVAKKILQLRARMDRAQALGTVPTLNPTDLLKIQRVRNGLEKSIGRHLSHLEARQIARRAGFKVEEETVPEEGEA